MSRFTPAPKIHPQNASSNPEVQSHPLDILMGDPTHFDRTERPQIPQNLRATGPVTSGSQFALWLNPAYRVLRSKAVESTRNTRR